VGWTWAGPRVPHRDYGFYLLYRQVLESIGDVRSLTENTFGLAD
jgi:hypothetical protein